MNLAELDATALAALIREGKLSPVESVQAAIERIEATNPSLNAVIHPRFERALDEARNLASPTSETEHTAPFAGVPLLLKDSGCAQAGEPHHAGLAPARDAAYTESRDGWLTERFRSAGFIVVGRTNAPELACAGTTEPLSYGPTRNPWNLEHSSGGSSGGSAAAVAALQVPIAHGGDGGGSIRMPAGCCGIVGLKPARGRLTLGPNDAEHWAGLSTDGVMTRSVRDTAAVIDWISGPGIGDPYAAYALPRTLAEACRQGRHERRSASAPLRIGIRRDAFGSGERVHPEVGAAIDLAESMLIELGHVTRPDSPTALGEDDMPGTQGIVVSSCVGAALDGWSARIGREIALDELEPNNARTVEAARTRGAIEFVQAREALHAYSRRLVAWWSDFDLLVLPTITDLTPRLGEMHADMKPEEMAALRARLGWLTPPWNITGQPAISLPLAVSDSGLPIGIQLVAAPDREDLLIEIASALEQLRGGFNERAPLHA